VARADPAKHAIPEQAGAQSGPASSATAIRHATIAPPDLESRFIWPTRIIINPFVPFGPKVLPMS